MELNGKVIVVTGGGRGIGRATCHYLAQCGARVLVNDLGCDELGRGSDAQVAQAVVHEICAGGGIAIPSTVDVTAEGATEQLIEHAIRDLGPVHAMVANAGIRHEGNLLRSKHEDFNRMLNTQFRAPFSATCAFAKYLVDSRSTGSIVLTTAPSAFFGGARQSVSASTSAAVVGLVRSAALELRKYGIRVNAVAPTARTRLTQDLPLFRGIQPDSMSPEHIAPIVAFLVSDLAAEVSGEVLGVAGSRVYSLVHQETAGAFSDDGPFKPNELLDKWAGITGTGVP